MQKIQIQADLIVCPADKWTEPLSKRSWKVWNLFCLPSTRVCLLSFFLLCEVCLVFKFLKSPLSSQPNRGQSWEVIFLLSLSEGEPGSAAYQNIEKYIISHYHVEKWWKEPMLGQSGPGDCKENLLVKCRSSRKFRVLRWAQTPA